jgi:hypothetical protein
MPQGATWIKAVSFLLIWVWAVVMSVAGLWVLAFVPILEGMSERPYWVLALGSGLLAGGCYACAWNLQRVLPLTHPAAKAVFELSPWVALVGVLIGGLI